MLAMRMDTEFFVGAGGEEVASVARAAAAQTERPYALLATRPSGTAAYLSRGGADVAEGRGDGAARRRAGAGRLRPGRADRRAAGKLYAQGLLDLTACTLARADWAAMKLLKGDAYCPLCADLAAEAAERAFAAGGRNRRAERKGREDPGGIAFDGGGRRGARLGRRAAGRLSGAGAGPEDGAVSGSAPYPASLAGAVAALLNAYRAFDPDSALPRRRPGRAGKRCPLTGGRGSARCWTGSPPAKRLPAAVQKVAPELTAAVPPLDPPRAAGIAACQGWRTSRRWRAIAFRFHDFFAQNALIAPDFHKICVVKPGGLCYTSLAYA